MSDISLSIGEKISLYRKRKGISRKQLAEILNVSPQTIANYENGVTLPEMRMLSTLAAVLGVNLDNLLFDEQEESKRGGARVPKLTRSQLENMF